jgi:hypothetical protein
MKPTTSSYEARPRIFFGIPALAALGLVLTTGATATADQVAEEPNLVLNLSWHDSQNLLPWSRKATTEKVKEIFRKVDVKVNWIASGDKAYMRTGAGRLRVILMPTSASQFRLPTHTMGVVFVDEAPRRFVCIFLPNVVRTLGYHLGAKRPRRPRERTFITRALARVISHEIVHAICPSEPHTATGLMSARLTRNLLTQSRLEIAPQITAALHANLSGPFRAQAVPAQHVAAGAEGAPVQGSP